mmetsp:Transcript_15272/g.53199  ORF Transcript_15272/g.53199 Transcript_15272/m.53199 type:complete len:226 (-) Transcript_15272:195-872(-)
MRRSTRGTARRKTPWRRSLPRSAAPKRGSKCAAPRQKRLQGVPTTPTRGASKPRFKATRRLRRRARRLTPPERGRPRSMRCARSATPARRAAVTPLRERSACRALWTTQSSASPRQTTGIKRRSTNSNKRVAPLMSRWPTGCALRPTRRPPPPTRTACGRSRRTWKCRSPTWKARSLARGPSRPASPIRRGAPRRARCRRTRRSTPRAPRRARRYRPWRRTWRSC